jgi:hypothetical protein
LAQRIAPRQHELDRHRHGHCGDAYTDRHAKPHADDYGHTRAQRDSNGDIVTYAHSFVHTYADRNGHGHTHTDAHTHSHRHSYSYSVAANTRWR